MSDLLIKMSRNRAGAALIKALGLPNPVELARAEGGYATLPFAGKTVLLAGAAGGYAAEALSAAAGAAGAAPLRQAPADAAARLDVVLLDATGCATPAALRALYDTFHPLMRRIARNGRVLIVAAPPELAAEPVAAAAARAVEGFNRSLGKELGKQGITVNLAYVAPDAVERLAGVLRFFGGVQSTYVSGQTLRLRARVAAPAALPHTAALAGKVALVTGAARGIGLATAQRLAQEGAHVVCLDVPAAAEELARVCGTMGATALPLDIATAEAPARLAAFLKEQFGGVDIVVHNAGITRDRTLANMKEHYWDMVVGINFGAIVAIDAELLASGALRDEGRVVCLSSISGVAGNYGQTNYATSKAALIGYVAAQAPLLAPRGIAINAIAPGFIETAMTAQMPFLTREIGRRANSLQQGGQPRDAAELIAFLCTPGCYGVSGETIRVCGQGLIGA